MKKMIEKFTLFLWGGLACGMGHSLGGAVDLRDARARSAIEVQLTRPEVAGMKEMILIASRFLAECSHITGSITTRRSCKKTCLVARNRWPEKTIVFERNGFECGLLEYWHLSKEQVARLCRVLNKHCHDGDGRELQDVLGIQSHMLVTQETLRHRMRELLLAS